MNKQAILKKLSQDKLVINYILRRRLTKQADTLSMPFTPSTPPTNSFDSLIQERDPTIAPSSQRAIQHPAIPDINQRYKTVPGDRDTASKMLSELNDHNLTPEVKKQFVRGVKNYDLMRFLLGRGNPSKFEPYLYNTNLTPTGWHDSQIFLNNLVDRRDPTDIHSSVHLPFLMGHESQHVVDLNGRLDYNPYFKPINFNRPTSLEILRREGAATLGHYAALKKALSYRPDLYDRYVQMTMPLAVPAYSSYMSLHAPNAIREVGEVASGAAGALLGATNPLNWNRKGLQQGYQKGVNLSHKLLGEPVTASPMPTASLQSWQIPLNQYLIRHLGEVADNVDIDAWNTLMDEIREEAKLRYGYNPQYPKYNYKKKPSTLDRMKQLFKGK